MDKENDSILSRELDEFFDDNNYRKCFEYYLQKYGVDIDVQENEEYYIAHFVAQCIVQYYYSDFRVVYPYGNIKFDSAKNSFWRNYIAFKEDGQEYSQMSNGFFEYVFWMPKSSWIDIAKQYYGDKQDVHTCRRIIDDFVVALRCEHDYACKILEDENKEKNCLLEIEYWQKQLDKSLEKLRDSYKRDERIEDKERMEYAESLLKCIEFHQANGIKEENAANQEYYASEIIEQATIYYLIGGDINNFTRFKSFVLGVIKGWIAKMENGEIKTEEISEENNTEEDTNKPNTPMDLIKKDILVGTNNMSYIQPHKICYFADLLYQIELDLGTDIFEGVFEEFEKEFNFRSIVYFTSKIAELSKAEARIKINSISKLYEYLKNMEVSFQWRGLVLCESLFELDKEYGLLTQLDDYECDVIRNDFQVDINSNIEFVEKYVAEDIKDNIKWNIVDSAVRDTGYGMLVNMFNNQGYIIGLEKEVSYQGWYNGMKERNIANNAAKEWMFNKVLEQYFK